VMAAFRGSTTEFDAERQCNQDSFHTRVKQTRKIFHSGLWYDSKLSVEILWPYLDAHISNYLIIISLKDNQQDATFSRSIYFYKLLCMFQAVPPPIIRSTKLYIQRQVLSTPFHLTHDSSTQQYWFDNTWRCMYSFVLLMMGGGTAWNLQSNL
jgi:hypothetical protein